MLKPVFTFQLYSIMAERRNNNRIIFETWSTIQDIIGPANQWPYSTRRLFWTKHLKHWDRLRISAFVYVNGLNPDIFLEWARLQDLGRDASAYRHFEVLLKTVFPNTNYNLYAWNVTNRRYEWIDGTVRHYVHAAMRH